MRTERGLGELLRRMAANGQRARVGDNQQRAGLVGQAESGRREVTATDLIMFAAVVGVDPRTLLERILRW
jgi:hypothetical protein